MERFELDNVLIQDELVGVKRLGWLERAVHASAAELITYSEADFEWLTRWLQMLSDPETYGTIEMAVTLDDVAKFQLRLGGPLPEMVKGADAGGTPRWELVDEAKNDQSRARKKMKTRKKNARFRARDAEAQLNYVKRGWLVQLAKNLVDFIAELTPERAVELKPGVLKRLTDLMGVLIVLDEMNLDSALPFELRPNPRVDLFGDVSYMVLPRRLAVAEEAWTDAHVTEPETDT